MTLPLGAPSCQAGVFAEQFCNPLGGLVWWQLGCPGESFRAVMYWVLIAIQGKAPPVAAVLPEHDHPVRPCRLAGGPPERCPASFLMALVGAVTEDGTSRDESGIGGTSIRPE
ncbi:hypothetical protein ACFVMA_01180 [Streptomyces rochei]|uniref:hypothetical protein n=1 Tax=Streptomyces rochei TaxID=1928 RepID=UPI003682CAC7